MDDVDLDLDLTVPHGLNEIEQAFGRIEYEAAEGGMVQITNNWEEENILQAMLPIVGKQLVHKLMVAPFSTALRRVEEAGLADEIIQFYTYCPRFKMHNPWHGLSTHSWGIACDINPAGNPVGHVGMLHPGIVLAFEMTGFQWGGRWKSMRDDMHMQYATGW